MIASGRDAQQMSDSSDSSELRESTGAREIVVPARVLTPDSLPSLVDEDAISEEELAEEFAHMMHDGVDALRVEKELRCRADRERELDWVSQLAKGVTRQTELGSP